MEDVADTCCGQALATTSAICKEHFSFALTHLWICLKVTLECSSFPSWKPTWWSNILDSPASAWSHLLQVTKIYPETGIFETPGLQLLGTNALTAGDVNKSVHCLCMCSSPAQPPQVWDRAGHCSAPDKQMSCLQTLSHWVYRALLLLLKMESCHFVCILVYHPPSDVLWMQWGFCHSHQWSPRGLTSEEVVLGGGDKPMWEALKADVSPCPLRGPAAHALFRRSMSVGGPCWGLSSAMLQRFVVPCSIWQLPFLSLVLHCQCVFVWKTASFSFKCFWVLKTTPYFKDFCLLEQLHFLIYIFCSLKVSYLQTIHLWNDSGCRSSWSLYKPHVPEYRPGWKATLQGLPVTSLSRGGGARKSNRSGMDLVVQYPSPLTKIHSMLFFVTWLSLSQGSAATCLVFSLVRGLTAWDSLLPSFVYLLPGKYLNH